MTADERREVEDLIARLEREASLLRKLVDQRDGALLAWRHARKEAEAAKEPTRPAVVEWLEERFREKREWPAGELWERAHEAGFRDADLFSREASALPFFKGKRTDTGRSVWWARDGWPGPKKAEGRPEPARPSIVEWLEERFREKREWSSDEIWRLATAAGFNDADLLSFEVNTLPFGMARRRGTGQTVWWAMVGWPGPKERGCRVNALPELRRREAPRALDAFAQPRRKHKAAVSNPHADRKIVRAAYALSDAGRRISRANVRHQGVRASNAAIDNVLAVLVAKRLIDRALVAGEAPPARVDLKEVCRRHVGAYRRAMRRLTT